MMAGLGAGAGPPVHGADRTGAVEIVWGGGLLVLVIVGTLVTFGGNEVGVSLGTLGDGAGRSVWKTTAGAGRGALGA